MKLYCLRQLFLLAIFFFFFFFWFLRISEFARTGKNQDFDVKLTSFEDITFSGSILVVRIRNSKTDRVGTSSTLQIESSSNPFVCPMAAMYQYLISRPTHSGPLFIHFGGEVLTS